MVFKIHSLFLLPVLIVATSASATVGHPDLSGVEVDFTGIQETTQTPADPEPMFQAPILVGDVLQFTPSQFISACTGAGTSDDTGSLLEVTVTAKPGQHIEVLQLTEAGDTTLSQFPPFGDAGTNSSASITGTVTVTETTSGPIAPVVIPFTGSFTPSSSFALPTNFGLTNWSGAIDVDVAAAVPLATQVEVALTNTLSTNCSAASPTSSAQIEKKSVSGPAVSLAVNPLECDLELDKTCCLTQPALPDLGSIEGDIVKLTFEFTGDKCRKSNNDQGWAFRCYGRRKVKGPATIDVRHSSTMSALPSSGVDKGDTVMITSSTGVLDDWLKIKTTGQWWRKQYIRMDTSGDRAINCGDQFGAYKVTGIESTIGGVVDCNAPPGPPQCLPGLSDPVGTPCDGQLVDMVLEYNGQDCQDPLPNPQNGSASCTGDATGATDVRLNYTGSDAWRQRIVPAAGINDGDRIRVTATWVGGCPATQKYVISDSGGVRQQIEFRAGCNKPLALGDEFGSFKVVEFTTTMGNTYGLPGGGSPPADSCEVPLAPPGPHCTDDLESISLVYIGDFLGEGCTVSNAQSGFAACTGVADPGDPVAVTTAAGIIATPDDQIEFGDVVEFAPGSGSVLPNLLWFDASGSGGTQGIDMKTSCAKPLSLGDRFGGWVVFAMDRVNQGPVSLGGNVQYQYAVTNPGTSTVDNVAIDDSELGVVVSGVSLLPGETQTFTADATLFGTTTNVATATGDVSGDVCNPGQDQVTVSVTAPPPGAFSCSAPLSGFSVIWNGAQTVDIDVFDGPYSPAAVPHTVFEDVAPGDAVEVTGLTAAMESHFYITDAATSAVVGQSKFTLNCWDWAMNGVEDCGKFLGNGRYDNPSYINDWLLEGMTDVDETFSCTPGLVPNPPACGFGPELLVVMPGLMLWHRRRLHKES